MTGINWAAMSKTGDEAQSKALDTSFDGCQGTKKLTAANKESRSGPRRWLGYHAARWLTGQSPVVTLVLVIVPAQKLCLICTLRIGEAAFIRKYGIRQLI